MISAGTIARKNMAQIAFGCVGDQYFNRSSGARKPRGQEWLRLAPRSVSEADDPWRRMTVHRPLRGLSPDAEPSCRRALLPRGLQQLALREIRKRAGLGDKLPIASHLHDLAANQHDDPVRIADRAQPMRDHHPRDGEPLE